MSDDLTRYLAAFTEKANNIGLPVRRPGKNWSPLEPLDRRSHVSLSVTRHRIQVNLNNEDDDDGTKLARLHADRGAIEEEVGETLLWEKKNGRRKLLSARRWRPAMPMPIGIGSTRGLSA